MPCVFSNIHTGMYLHLTRADVMPCVFQNFLLRVASHSILSKDSLFQGFLKDVSVALVPECTAVFACVVCVLVRKLELGTWETAGEL